MLAPTQTATQQQPLQKNPGADEAERLLHRVQDFVVTHQIPVPGWRAGEEERRRFYHRICGVLTELPDAGIQRAAIPQTAQTLVGLMTGIGLLTQYMDEPDVEEIIVRNGFVQLERHGRIFDVGRLADDAHFHAIALRAGDLGGRTVKADQPFVLVDLPSGDRLTAIIEPLSANGTAINIRKFARQSLSLNDLQEKGAFNQIPTLATAKVGLDAIQDAHIRARVEAVRADVGRFLAWVAATNAATVLIAGEYSSGKTTLLNALSQYFPRELQLAVVETFHELKLQHPHAVRAIAPARRRSSSEPGVTMADVINVIYTRMRPDAVVIGEIVAGEAAEFLRAINLGKRAYATIHGDGVLSALYRLESLVESAGLPHGVVREWIARGLDLVVVMGRTWNRARDQSDRFVAEVAALNGLDASGHYRFTSLYKGYETRQQRVQTLTQMWEAMRARRC